MNSGFESIITRLQSEAAAIREAIQRQEADRDSRPADGGGDELDLAMDALELDKSNALIRQLQRKLEQIDAALSRVATGKYGVCEDCHQHIPPARLEVVPYATVCVTCQSRRDRRQGFATIAGRPA